MSNVNSPSRVYLIDKVSGISSFAALTELKKRIKTKKVGHAGTLDPFATGLLVAMSGKMTRAISLVSDADKEYFALIRFGEETNTLDSTGHVIARAPVPSYQTIATVVGDFLGEITQRPPDFSAIKINGKRAYALAREDKAITMPERRVNIHQIEIISWKAPDITLRILCSKGTYIRSLARDIALASGSRAYCAQLRRTSIGPFSVDMVSPDISQGLSPSEFCEKMGIPVYSVESDVAKAMRLGQLINTIPRFEDFDDEFCLVLDKEGREVAFLAREEGSQKYKIVFN